MASDISWNEFESIIARLQTTFSKGATVTRDEKLPGKLSGRSREIDVCIRTKVGTENVLIIVECKRHKRKADVKAVEAFIGVKKDVGAQMGIMVSSEGFSRSAYKRANDESISLYRHQDTQKENWPNGLDTSALLEIWELTPLIASYVLENGTEEAIKSDEELECVDVRGGPKTTLADLLREMWNSLEAGDRYERDWCIECPASSPERPEIKKLRLGARAKFVRGLKKGRLHFEGLVNESEGQAKVAGWKMVFDGEMAPWPVEKSLPASKSLSVLVKSVFVQSQNPDSQKLQDLIYTGSFFISVAGKEVMHLPINDAPSGTTVRRQKKTLDEPKPGKSTDATTSPASGEFHLSPFRQEKALRIKFVSSSDSIKIKEFFEKREPFQLETMSLHSDSSSMFQQLQCEFDAPNMATANQSVIEGCIQLSTGSGNQVSFFQVDGHWTRTVKRLSFDGHLKESPLQIRLHRDILASGNLDSRSPIHFNIDWGRWQGQQLLSLSYLEEIRQFLYSSTFAVKCLAKGNEIGRVEMGTGKTDAVKEAQNAIDAIVRYRSAAKYLGVNPKFPFSNKVKTLPRDDADVLAKLIESGVHEQDLAGQIFCMEADAQPGSEKLIKKRIVKMEQHGQICLFDFFGQKVQFGPVTYLFTDVELTSVNNLENNRMELYFTGCIGSKWRITHHRPDRSHVGDGSV